LQILLLTFAFDLWRPHFRIPLTFRGISEMIGTLPECRSRCLGFHPSSGLFHTWFPLCRCESQWFFGGKTHPDQQSQVIPGRRPIFGRQGASPSLKDSKLDRLSSCSRKAVLVRHAATIVMKKLTPPPSTVRMSQTGVPPGPKPYI
jgi:hypothetical protein